MNVIQIFINNKTVVKIITAQVFKLFTNQVT